MTDNDKPVTDDPKAEEVKVEEPAAEETAEEPTAAPADDTTAAPADDTTAAPADDTTVPVKTDQRGRQLYSVKCAECGKQTEVPFKPSGDRPVYCRDCYMRRKG